MVHAEHQAFWKLDYLVGILYDRPSNQNKWLYLAQLINNIITHISTLPKLRKVAKFVQLDFATLTCEKPRAEYIICIFETFKTFNKCVHKIVRICTHLKINFFFLKRISMIPNFSQQKPNKFFYNEYLQFQISLYTLN